MGFVMGKMSKKNLEELKRDDPKENNWEIEENEEVRIEKEEDVREQVSAESAVLKQAIADELKEIFDKTFPTLDSEKDAAREERIIAAWYKVDPEIRTGNPVWLYSEKSNQFVFIFRDGRKVRVEM